MLPGTANTGLPYRSAWDTVDIVPLFSRASTTSSADDSAAMSRLRCKKPTGPGVDSPGADSLKAAAHPAKTPYLYFVADGKGGHTFNTNLASHNKSVQDYLKVLKEKNAQ